MQETVTLQFRDEVFNRYLAALDQTQWGDRVQLARYQQGLLTRLIQHARAQVPFYRDRLACLFARDGRIDLGRWSEVPIFTRAKATSSSAAMRSSPLPEMFGAVQEFSTSGSTGTPLQIAANFLQFIAANAALTRLARWWKLDTARALARITIFQAAQAAPYPGRDRKGWSAANPEADVHDLDLLTPVDQQIEWLARKQAPYLMTTPSNALALSLAATPEQARALRLEAVLSIAETVLPGVPEIVAQRLGAPLIAIYSCQEVGFIGTQCPVGPGYHVVAENAVVEILDDDGEPVRPGEAGQIVLTGLYNYAMPFIRYAIGDVGTAGEDSCRCGRTLPLIARIEGRTRHAFVFEDGTRIWPRIFTLREIGGFVPSRELQVVQVDRRRIECRYVPDGTGRTPDAPGLAAYVRAKFHASAEPALVPVEAIPRGPGGKFDPFLCLVPE